MRRLKGKILGFEEIEDYFIESSFGDESPFRLLRAENKPLAFVLVNPYRIIDEYSFEVDERILERDLGIKKDLQSLAVMCIVRIEEDKLFVNLRAPLLVNTDTGRFCQILLENDRYGVSVPFAVKNMDG